MKQSSFKYFKDEMVSKLAVFEKIAGRKENVKLKTQNGKI
jgi:hypothetical protein